MNQLDFIIQNIQGVLFIENFAFRNKLGIASKINETVNNLFDGDPTILDLPPEAPLEIPRIQLKDSKPAYSLNFCANRIDFFYNDPGKPEKKLSDLRDEYINYFSKIVTLVKYEYHLSTPRLAIILKAVSDIQTGANSFLQENFLGRIPFFGETHTLEIHALEKRQIREFDINRWFRIKTARTPTGRDDILFVEIDINTQPEKPRDFGKEEISDFCINSLEFAKENFLNCFGVSL
ncbi:MAG: hypothetical protein FJ115_06285 [Deltaproteobacteria bacterium]|nr:hypothetical protein [Deltaproteobacteria bacterium]MBM4323151.1 hypothetical protein [Deltaproteobacteria bacterium]